MKALFLSLVIIAIGSLTALAEVAAGSIVSVDAKAQSITVSAGADVLTYHVGLTSDITINGVKAQFSGLAAGMGVRVTTNGPGVAGKIVATNVGDAIGGQGAGAVATAKLQALLVETKWDWHSAKDKSNGVFITFGKEEAFFSDNPTNKYKWKAVDGKTIEYGDHRFSFNPAMTELECPNWVGRGKFRGKRLP